MDLRHELKMEISYTDMLVLRQRLKAVASLDAHAAADGRYHIRSLYFDNINDKALREKIDGVSRREKFRIRYYNGDLSVINLEKKSKYGGLGNKNTAPLTKDEAEMILNGDLEWMLESRYPVIKELYVKMTAEGLRPKTIVDYVREPFIFKAGNVRVTIDYDIRTGLFGTDFLNPECTMIPAALAPVILEVKWDEFLPDIIRDIIQLPEGRREGAFSKYAACRMYD